MKRVEAVVGKVKLEIIVTDSKAPIIAKAVADLARTGHTGDGMIVVTPICFNLMKAGNGSIGN